MIKRKKIKYMYIEEAYCDKCGSKLEPTGAVLTSWPEQFPYVCSNKDCDFSTTFYASERPNVLRYEFGEEETVSPIEVTPEGVFVQTTKICPHCTNAYLRFIKYHDIEMDIYECPECGVRLDVKV